MTKIANRNEEIIKAKEAFESINKGAFDHIKKKIYFKE